MDVALEERVPGLDVDPSPQLETETSVLDVSYSDLQIVDPWASVLRSGRGHSDRQEKVPETSSALSQVLVQDKEVGAG